MAADRTAGALCAALALAVGCESAPAPATTPASSPAPSPASSSAATAPSTSTPSTRLTPPAPRTAAGLHYLVLYTAGAQATARLPLVVGIHGLGDRPESFSGLLDDLPFPARVVVPRALSPHGRGYSWFNVRVAAEVRRAADRLAAALEVLAERYPTRGKPIVAGFSQGGMLSFALAVLHPETIAFAAPVSGWLPPDLVPAQATSVPIRALHGDADRLLPIAPTRESVAKLRALGTDVELREYPGVGHTVTPAMRRALFVTLIEAAAKQR